MGFVSRFVAWLGPAQYVFGAAVVTGVTIGVLLLFILIRRAVRFQYLRERDRRTLLIRQKWPQILFGEVPPESWRFHAMNRDIVEAIITDRLDVAGADETRQLLQCLRVSGLVDIRTYETRALRGWRRRRALVSLGRMRAPESIPALAEALDDRDPETRIAALRGLGRTALPEAAEPILDRLVRGQLAVPERPLLNALLRCCRRDPSLLVAVLSYADDEMRPLLARVLSETASPDMSEDLLFLAADPLPEVRASTARALGKIRNRLALTALSHLCSDEQWFVRLRAVVALGDIADPLAIPVLLDTLCDRNRYVRLRSAVALVRLEEQLDEILSLVVSTHDRYALQAFVSELERTGRIAQLIDALAVPARRPAVEAALLGALRAGTQRLLLGSLTHHPAAQVRKAIARLLARSGEKTLVPSLLRMESTARTAHARRLARWVRRRLAAEASAPAIPAGVVV
jgi:HEAT repeat protein